VAKPVKLTRAPITEALVDIRADAPNAPEAFDQLRERLKSEFPTTEVRNALTAELRIENGKLVAPNTKDLGPHGLQMSNAEGTLTVQFRRDGFTLNNLKTYLGGERLVAKALELWTVFAGITPLSAPSRLAIRYINKLELPLSKGVDFDTFLTSAPDLPPEIPDHYAEFLSRVVAHHGDDEKPYLIVTQHLTNEAGRPVVVIDLDGFLVGTFPSDKAALTPILKQIVDIQRAAFFSLITEATVKIYA